MKTETLNNYCVKSYENSHYRCLLTLLDDSKVSLEKKCNRYNFVEDCNDSAMLQMSIHDYNLMQGLTANMLGFTLVFLVSFLFILQGRR